jgi:hypothetical protein
MRNYGIRQVQPAARVLLICPDCGHETSELADALRGMGAFYCTGDDCDYLFDLVGPRKTGGKAFTDACKRFYAAFYAMRGQSSR